MFSPRCQNGVATMYKWWQVNKQQLFGFWSRCRHRCSECPAPVLLIRQQSTFILVIIYKSIEQENPSDRLIWIVTTHCANNNLKLRVNTEPVTVGAAHAAVNRKCMYCTSMSFFQAQLHIQYVGVHKTKQNTVPFHPWQARFLCGDSNYL